MGDRKDAGQRPHTVVMVLLDEAQTLDVIGPLDVFAAANDNGARYRLCTASPGGREVRTTSGVRLAPDLALESLSGPIDTLLVPGRTDWRAALRDTRLLNGIAQLSQTPRRIASVCSGAFYLAAIGLLDGRRAATHWALVDDLAREFPKVKVDRDAIFVRDGNVATSAGVTAGIDLALSLVEEDFGPAVARATAKYLVVFMARPGGQSQFSVRMDSPPPRNPVVRTILDAVTADPGGDHTRDTLAARAGVSVRHLTRLFRTELGTTATRFVARTRVEAATGLLEAGTDTLEVVARRSGFGSEETMRRAFKRELGIAPSAYRARYRTTYVRECQARPDHEGAL
ncbi:DJ-1/PfpI family protein [Actinoallomurus bryophytorum]|uniref:AraC family transcriptional regulator with amidase-like domain n=1 Tax=Actinoallomurus bryophytorum TaxID=1490222 RepID=A0A543C0J7_9ACTN|nr:GlxA family transcriptional regulator [Actinoallomurus bryophytorum]TQL90595.1 AraC family transcriptional regulator with amidase-like domain [Actinoallomurus bryophytorum]